MPDEEFPHLGPDMRDRAVSVVRGAGALMPHGGGIIGTLFGSLVPGQRIDRLEQYVETLGAKLDGLEETQEKVIASSPEHIDLFEEGAFRAARALTEDRIRHIALIVAIGMTKGTAVAIAQKRLLTILSDLDEQDIIMLNWRLQINKSTSGEYAENHAELLNSDRFPVTIWSSRDEREAEALKNAIDNKLLRYGLVELYDEAVPHGMKPRTSERISQLGLLILHSVGLTENETWYP